MGLVPGRWGVIAVGGSIRVRDEAICQTIKLSEVKLVKIRSTVHIASSVRLGDYCLHPAKDKTGYLAQ